MSGDFNKDDYDPDLLIFLSSFDTEQAILNGDAKWVIIWNQPNIHLVSEISEPLQRLIDLAHSDEAVLLPADKVEGQVEKLVDMAYLTREARGIYKIEPKLVKGLSRLTSKDP